MYKCVSDAERAPKKKGKKRLKISTWQIASDLYREAFIANCWAEEEQRLLIRASTTPEYIQEAYTARAAQHRAFVAAQTVTAQTGSAATPPCTAVDRVTVRLHGCASGCGIDIEPVPAGYEMITACAAGGAAANASANGTGFRVGDLLLTVDGESLQGRLLKEVMTPADTHEFVVARPRVDLAPPLVVATAAQALPMATAAQALPTQEGSVEAMDVQEAALLSAASGAEQAPSGAEQAPKEQRAKGRMKWREKIADGLALQQGEVGTLGAIALSEYLRAMGVKVSREDERDVEKLRTSAQDELQRRGVPAWSVNE